MKVKDDDNQDDNEHDDEHDDVNVINVNCWKANFKLPLLKSKKVS